MLLLHVCFNFMLILVLILINVQHSQKAAFSFEKGSNHQNHSSLGSLHPIKNLPQYNGIVVLCNCIMLEKKKDPFSWMGFNCLKAIATSKKQFTFYH